MLQLSVYKEYAYATINRIRKECVYATINRIYKGIRICYK